MRSAPTSAPKVPRVWPALGAIALAALLNPLNTSMIAVALVDVERSFGVEVNASTWLLASGILGERFNRGFRCRLIGLSFAQGATTPAPHQLAGIVGVPGVVLMAARRLVRDGHDQSPVSPSQTVIYDAGDVL